MTNETAGGSPTPLPRLPIPPIPRMTELDESWIDWAAGTYNIRPEIVRGMLAAYFTMRARHLAQGIAHIKGTIVRFEAMQVELTTNGHLYPAEFVAKDLALYEAILPQLQELAR